MTNSPSTTTTTTTSETTTTEAAVPEAEGTEGELIDRTGDRVVPSSTRAPGTCRATGGPGHGGEVTNHPSSREENEEVNWAEIEENLFRGVFPSGNLINEQCFSSPEIWASKLFTC